MRVVVWDLGFTEIGVHPETKLLGEGGPVSTDKRTVDTSEDTCGLLAQDTCRLQEVGSEDKNMGVVRHTCQ